MLILVIFLKETENRYRKYQRRKPLRKAMAMQLEEVIIEEREEDLMEESSTDNIYQVIPPNQVTELVLRDIYGKNGMICKCF